MKLSGSLEQLYWDIDPLLIKFFEVSPSICLLADYIKVATSKEKKWLSQLNLQSLLQE